MSRRDDDLDYPYGTPYVEEGFACTGEGCFHFIKDRDDENVYFHEGLPYCEPCYYALAIPPSEEPWNVNFEGWTVDDTEAFYGEDEK